MQVKLLRVLEDGVFLSGGERQAGPLQCPGYCRHQSRSLTKRFAKGTFRDDLYFRLGVIKINLLPLLERTEDILPLLCHFAAKEKLKGFSDGAIDLLLRYDWPGNVRQLRNFVARMGALTSRRGNHHSRSRAIYRRTGISQRHLPVVTGRTPKKPGMS